MKIFSAFDSSHKYRELADAQKKYGINKVLLLTKSKIYFIVRFIIPAVIVIIMRLGIIYVNLHYINDSFDHWVALGLTIFTMIVMIVIGYKSYVHHRLVFIIITPEKVDIYNQLGLFHRNVKSVFVQEISGIYIDKDGIRQSVVNNGYITIESDENQHTKVRFGPIDHPDEIKKKVENIIEKLITQPVKHSTTISNL